MSIWWNGLSERERRLLTLGGLVAGFAILFFLVIVPLTNFRAEARADYDRAVSTYQAVNRAVASAGTNRLDGNAVQSVLTSTAGQSNIVLNRIAKRPDDDSVDISIASTQTRQLFAWIALLEQQHNVIVVDAQIQPSGESTVTARMTFIGGGS